MTDGRVSIDIDVKYAAAIDAFLKLSQKIGSAGKELDAVGAKAKENARFLKQMEQAFQTPGDKYNADSQRLLQMRMQGKVSREDYSKIQTGLYKRYTETDPTFVAQKKAADELAASIKKAEQELKRYADRSKEINATPMERYAASVQKAKDALKAGQFSQEDYNREVARASDELQKASESGDEAFGTGAVGMLSRYLAGIMSVTAAVTLLKGMYDELAQARDKAFQDAQTQLEANLEATSAGATPEEKAKMLEQFHRYRTMPGAGGYTAEQTARGYSRAYQAGFDEQTMRELFLAGTQVGGDLESLAQLAETARVNFGKEGLTQREAMNAALSVAKVTQADPRDISKFYGQSLPLLAQGFSYSESIGMQAGLQTAFGKGQIGADRSRAIMTKLMQDEEATQMLSQGDASGILEMLRGMSQEEWADRFGNDAEAAAARLALQKSEVMDIYQKARDAAQAEIDAMRGGAGDTYIQRESAAFAKTPQIAEQIKAREARERSEQMAITYHATPQARTQSMLEELNSVISASSSVESHLGRPIHYLGRGFASVYDTLSGVTGDPAHSAIGQSVMEQVELAYQLEMSKSMRDNMLTDKESERLKAIESGVRNVWKTQFEGMDNEFLNRSATLARGEDSLIANERAAYIESLIKQQTEAAMSVKDAVINADGRTKSAIEAAKAAAGRN